MTDNKFLVMMAAATLVLTTIFVAVVVMAVAAIENIADNHDNCKLTCLEAKASDYHLIDDSCFCVKAGEVFKAE